MRNLKIVFLFSLCLCLVAFFSACSVTQEGNLPLATEKAVEEPTVIFQDVFGYSTEGGYLQAVILNEKMQYIHVCLFGEMGQNWFEYAFGDDRIVISLTTQNYTQPFYVDPENILTESIEKEQYLFMNEKLYNIVKYGSELYEVSEETYDEVINTMSTFIEIANQ